MKLISNLLAEVDSVCLYSFISFCIFVIIFTLILYYAFSQSSKKMKIFGSIPLENDNCINTEDIKSKNS